MIQPSVALIGSFRRHYQEVQKAAQAFEAAGIRVEWPPRKSRIIDFKPEFVRFESDPSEASDHDLQAKALERIFSSDFVYVVNPRRYIGLTTAYELGRIYERGMAVHYAEPPPKDLPLEIPDGTVLSARELAAGITGRSVQARPLRRPRVAALLAADIVIFTIRSGRLHVLLVKRGTKIYYGKLALPGGFVRPGECLEDTAKRELAEETGLNGSRILLQQMHTYSGPKRDPRGRVVTTAFLAIAPDLPEAIGGTDAHRADWIEVEESLWEKHEQEERNRLAFDHGTIMKEALERARLMLEHTTVAADFCGETFTVRELRQVYEAVWGICLNPQNFQRKVRNIKGFMIDTGEKQENRRGRPAELFKRGPARHLYPPLPRPGQRYQTSSGDMAKQDQARRTDQSGSARQSP